MASYGSIRTATPTEPCGTCRRPVPIGRWTVRSRFSGEALCDDHGTVPASFQPEWPEAVEHRRLQERGTATRATVDSARAYVDRILAFYATQSPEDRAEREWLTRTGSRTDDGYETRDVDHSRAEVRRYDPDGEPVFDREPDGQPRLGVHYAERWWATGGTETRAAS